MRKSAFHIAIALLVALLSAGPSCAGDYKRITGPELETMFKGRMALVIVDLREPGLYEKSHIPGAINMPYETARTRALMELDPKDKIVFVCHSGAMGDELARLLAENGYKKVYNLKGGMKNWKGPVEKGPAHGGDPGR